MISRFLRSIRRRTSSDDPFAPDETDWANRIISALLAVIIIIFWIGGSIMIIFACVYFLIVKHPPPAMKWVWPLWGGMAMMAFGFVIGAMLVGLGEHAKKRRDQRMEARRQRREEILESNRPPATVLLLLPPSLPDPLNAAVDIRDGPPNEDLQAAATEVTSVVRDQMGAPDSTKALMEGTEMDVGTQCVEPDGSSSSTAVDSETRL